MIIPCNSWLFFLRIRAIPEHFRPRGTLIICMILWLSTFTSFLVFPGYKFSSVETQDGRCEGETEYNSWLIFVPYLALVIFDTTTMMAILAGFAMHSPELSWFARVRSALSTKHMGHLSGVFVRSGLIYYLHVPISFESRLLVLTIVYQQGDHWDACFNCCHHIHDVFWFCWAPRRPVKRSDQYIS